MKLGNMTISIKTKLLVKFGTSEMICVELRAKSYFADVHVKHSYSHVQNTLQPCRQLMKFRIMTVSVKLKVLITLELQR